MATEYKDGTFGETLPINDAMEQFVQDMQDGTAKALHVGTFDEVEAEKARDDFRRDLQKSMDELTERLDELEKDESIIQPATPDQISKIAGK